MPEKDQEQNSEAEVPLPVDYAFWDVPGESAKVIYSLPLFHEIDFVVNEGYRKIPHGGIEVGGLLFGTIQAEAIRVEAFRDIDCEHASGPSLSFSDRDLAELRRQLSACATDKDLAQYKPIGWFLAHTRGPLELTETEAKIFDEFFPQPLQLTVLVKPERFQPTRFGFLVRRTGGEMPREASGTAVILPLPGRSHKAGQLIPSLPAPALAINTKRNAERASDKEPVRGRSRAEAEDRDEDSTEEKSVAVPAAPVAGPSSAELKKAVDPLPLSIWKVPPEEDLVPPLEETSEAQALELSTPADRAARKQLSRDRARIIEQAFPPLPAPPALFRPSALPSLPANAALPVPSAYDRYPRGMEEHTPEQEPRADAVLNPRSVTALALAALLGCLVGYIAYLQLPAPVIPIDVRPVNQMIVVSWPPDETRNSIYAAIRLNDGPPVPLSADEKRTGQVSLTATKDFKVEVLARNWVRDSRGIVRYLHSANGNGQVVPGDGPPIP